jgi:hypothetical protein
MIDPAQLHWHKSSFSNGTGGDCVEVAELPRGGRAVRDTKDRGRGPVLWFAASEWRAFVKGARNGEFDS